MRVRHQHKNTSKNTSKTQPQARTVKTNMFESIMIYITDINASICECLLECWVAPRPDFRVHIVRGKVYEKLNLKKAKMGKIFFILLWFKKKSPASSW